MDVNGQLHEYAALHTGKALGACIQTNAGVEPRLFPVTLLSDTVYCELPTAALNEL
jgi:hypothetical protein